MAQEVKKVETTSPNKTLEVLKKLETPKGVIKYSYYPLDLLEQTNNFIVFHIFAPTQTQGKYGGLFDTTAAQTRLGDATSTLLEQHDPLTGKLRGLKATVDANSGTQKDPNKKPDTTLPDESSKNKLSKSPAEKKQEDSIISKGVEAIEEFFDLKATNFNLLKRSIALYMPPGLTFAQSFSWEEAEFGGMGDVIRNGISWDNPAAIAKRTGFKTLTGLTEFLGVDTEGLIELRTGQVFNPYREILFKKHDNRTFSFEFKFSPRSEKEAQMIQEIVELFRFHSEPDITNESVSFFVYPSEFEIEFYHGEDQNVKVPKISTCACTNVTVKYGETQASTHHTGHFVETTLSLEFTELELLTKKRIEEGY